MIFQTRFTATPTQNAVRGGEYYWVYQFPRVGWLMNVKIDSTATITRVIIRSPRLKLVLRDHAPIHLSYPIVIPLHRFFNQIANSDLCAEIYYTLPKRARGGGVRIEIETEFETLDETEAQ